MTAVTATPQVMRDRLLLAIDGQSNICNMVVVMEVVSFLEKYPITKEALEETRLGKLINDVRKKTKNEDLAKRAKKLLRNWQKLIEPVKGDMFSKGQAATSWSSKGGAHACISAAAAALTSGKKGPELKSRNDFNNCTTRMDKPSSRKRKGEQIKEFIPAKICKATLNDKTQNGSLLITNGNGVDSETFTDTVAHPLLNRHVSEPLDKEISELFDRERLSKIPINPVKPHPSTLGCSKTPRSSSCFKTSVLQHQARQEQTVTGMRCRSRSPRFSLHSPQTSTPEEGVKQSSPQAHTISSTSVRTVSLDNSELELSSQPFSGSLQGFHNYISHPPEMDSQSSLSNAPLHISGASACSDTISFEDEGLTSNTGKKKRQKFRSKNYAVSLDGQTVEDCTKPVRLKDRRLPYDPFTGKIETSVHKDSFQEGQIRKAHGSDLQWSEQLKKSPSVTPSPFHQTDWKELSRSEIIQSYLSQQSSVLTSSGAHTTGAHFFMMEFLKKEEHRKKDIKKPDMLVSNSLPMELPGICREVTTDDLNRLHIQHWPGVNGCYDTNGTWYDWTKCISLDLHGDESRLNILPYVCLD